MRQILEQALAAFAAQVDGLQAVVLSALPDGLLVWAWTKTGTPMAALEFASLDRAATACLHKLSDDDSEMTLSLLTDELRIFSWPLLVESDARNRHGLVVNVVFDGDELPGMAMAHGQRLRKLLSEALCADGLFADDGLRDDLLAALLADGDPLSMLVRVAEQAELEVADLGSPQRLTNTQRGRVAAALEAIDAELAKQVLAQAQDHSRSSSGRSS